MFSLASGILKVCAGLLPPLDSAYSPDNRPTASSTRPVPSVPRTRPPRAKSSSVTTATRIPASRRSARTYSCLMFSVLTDPGSPAASARPSSTSSSSIRSTSGCRQPVLHWSTSTMVLQVSLGTCRVVRSLAGSAHVLPFLLQPCHVSYGPPYLVGSGRPVKPIEYVCMCIFQCSIRLHGSRVLRARCAKSLCLVPRRKNRPATTFQ